MTPELIAKRNLYPRRRLNLLIITAVFVYVLVVELCESYLAPFDGFVPEMSILGTLRIGLALIGLVGLAVTPIILWRSPFAGSIEAHIFAGALLELPALYGLVLFLMGGRRLDFYLFAAPSLVGLLLLLSQAGRWDRLAALAQSELDEQT